MKRECVTIRKLTTIFLFVLIVVLILTMIPKETSAYTIHTQISITGDGDFTSENGVTSGNGTPLNPYIIEGWEIDARSSNGIIIINTAAHFIIRNMFVHSSRLANGILLENVRNGHVENSIISNNSEGGIIARYSSNITIISNNISTNYQCLSLIESRNITINGNNILNCYSGINILYSRNLTMANNILTNTGVWINGDILSHFNTHSINVDNLVNNLPLHYYRNCGGIILDSVPLGQLIMTNCTQISISNLTIEKSFLGIELAFINGGILDNNVISSHKHHGVDLFYSNNVTIKNNTIWNNSFGMGLYFSINITVYHNSLLNNLQGVQDGSGSENSWDDGYPSGGNYWSDYSGVDQYSGSNQDQPGPDGIGDNPYVIDVDSQDRYPLMYPLFDIIPPTIMIISPAESETFTHSPIMITGTAEDKGGSGIHHVEIQVNNGNRINATGTISWNATVELIPGSNVLEVWAWDKAGNPSTSAVITIFYTPPQSSEANYKPLVSVFLIVILIIIGLILSKYKQKRNKTHNTSTTKILLIITLPFVVLEIIIGTVSYLTGSLSIPPLLGIGIVVDLFIFFTGILITISSFLNKDDDDY